MLTYIEPEDSSHFRIGMIAYKTLMYIHKYLILSLGIIKITESQKQIIVEIGRDF